MRAVAGRAQNPPRGATGRAAPRAGRHADPRSADFLRIPWRVWAPPPRIAARGPKRGADEGHTGTRPRGPAGPRQATPPPGRLRPVVQGCERRRAAHGTPPGHPPQTRRDTPQRAPLTCHSGSRHGGRTKLAEFGPSGTTEPTPARIGRARAEGTRRRGCGGPPPRASRPEPPRRGERGSASDSPGGPSWQGPLYLILGHYYFTTL